jgi:hypothetical protein
LLDSCFACNVSERLLSLSIFDGDLCVYILYFYTFNKTKIHKNGSRVHLYVGTRNFDRSLLMWNYAFWFGFNQS